MLAAQICICRGGEEIREATVVGSREAGMVASKDGLQMYGEISLRFNSSYMTLYPRTKKTATDNSSSGVEADVDL